MKMMRVGAGVGMRREVGMGIGMKVMRVGGGMRVGLRGLLTEPGGRGMGLVLVPPRISQQTSAGRGKGGREELLLSFVVAFLRFVAGI